MIITQIRTEAAMDRTHGLVFIDGDLFCHSLEDTARPDGVKIAKETCIPAGLYKLGMETSPKYGADTLTIFDVPMFQGIRIHGGNDINDTEGCPMYAFNRFGAKIQGRADLELKKRLKAAGGSCLLVIVNHFKPLG